MNNTIVFVYAKDGKIKVLNCNEVKRLHDELSNDSWKHTNTLEVSTYSRKLN